MPSFFIRTSGCNLRCRWCDTPYTSWTAEGTRRSVDVLVAEAEEAGVHHIVVTGGEPLLQREIGLLTRRLAGHHVTIETAGTVAPDFNCDLLSLSPKTASSDPPGGRRARHRSLRSDLASARSLIQRFGDYQLKFVIVDEDDLTEVLEIVDALHVDDPCRVVLMPEGRSVTEVRDKSIMVAALCVEHGFRYTPRLHLDLFGGARGT